MGISSRLLRRPTDRVLEMVRSQVTGTTRSLFDHAPYPLEHTLDYRGDPGLLGPESVSWPVIADTAAFIGGLRSLLIQTAHPEVVAGVEQHSRYREDPLGRLSRTSAYVTATTFGAMPEVEEALTRVRRVHRVVKGVSSRGIAYDADDPAYSAWVHNVLTDSFLVANQVYGERRLDVDDADTFVQEQTRIGDLVGADPMPETAAGLSSWIESHPDIAPSAAMDEVIEFLCDPPLTAGVKAGYKVLFEASLATVPVRIREILGLAAKPGAELAGKAVISGLRWATGYSPSWALALTRCDAEIPWDLFRDVPIRRAS